MSLSVGIVGLPNSGKSTLFNALLSRQIAQVAEYPFTTIEPNTGVVEVPDERLTRLVEMVKPDPSTPSTPLRTSSLRTAEPKVVPAAIKFIDIAGLVKGAHQGEGLGNKFLSHIREVDVIVHVLRTFKNPNVSHVHGQIDPVQDAEIVTLELELAEIKKPTLYVLNIDEEQIGQSFENLKFAGGVIPICAKLEADLADLSPEEKSQYLKEVGLQKSGLDLLIQAAYKLLGLITFFTIKGGKQVQAWSIKEGATALEAAGTVHTDFGKNFIKAEVVSFGQLAEAGSWRQAEEQGRVRIEGRDSLVQDGDVIEFKTSS